METATLDAMGRTIARHERVGGQAADWTYTYDGAGRLTSVAGPTPWSEGYDAQGHVVSRTDAAGKIVQYTVDATGAVLAESGPHPERIWTYTYDALGRVVSKTLGQNKWKYAYGEGGPGTVAETDPRGSVTRQTYDAAGRLRKVDRAGKQVTELVYDGRWQQKETVTEGGWKLEVSTAYDDRGRLLSRQEAWSSGEDGYDYLTETPWKGRTATYAETWKAGGRTENRSGTLRVNSLGLLAERTIGVTDRFTYDGLGYPSTESLAGRPTRSWEYSGGVPMVEQEGLEQTSWTYYPTGRVNTETEPSGRVRTLSWDPRGLVLSNAYGGDAWSYTYDDAGTLKTATHGGSTWQYDHGSRGELRSVSLPGNVGFFSYGRDELGRLTKIEVSPVDASTPVREYAHDELGRETKRTRGSASWNTVWSSGVGTTTLPNGDQQALTYDGRGRVVRKRVTAGRRA